MSKNEKFELFENQLQLETLFNAYKLSFAQRDTARLVLMGKGNAEIADKLGIQVKTVKYHCTEIFKRTGVSNRVQFIVRFQYEYMRLSILADLDGTKERINANWTILLSGETQRLRACESELETIKSSTINPTLLTSVWPIYLKMMKFSTGLEQSQVEQFKLHILLRLIKRRSKSKISN